MTRKLKPLDYFFLASETRRSPWNMAGCLILEKPADYRGNFVTDLLKELRGQPPGYPFNVKPVGLGLWPSWEEADFDFDYHVRRQVLPTPGSERELMGALEHFSSTPLDRDMPLWECCFFEGLEENRFAIGFKLHHAVIDGQGGLTLLMNALSLRENDRRARAIWADNSDSDTVSTPRRPRSGRSKGGAGLLPMLEGLAADMARLVDPRRLDELRDLWLFRAPRSPMNKPLASSARRFGIGRLSLPLMKRIARSSGATVNDVLLYGVDVALHRYLEDNGRDVGAAFVCGMPVSTRAGKSTGGNQAGIAVVELGAPDSKFLARLEQISASTGRAKTNVHRMPGGVRVGYALSVLGLPLLLEQVPGLADALPIMNVAISNVSPPRGSNYLGKPLYMGGARVLGMYTQPILPPSVLLNVTAASVGDDMCLGIGSTRQAIAEPMRYAGYMAEATEELARKCGVAASTRKRAGRRPVKPGHANSGR